MDFDETASLFNADTYETIIMLLGGDESCKDQGLQILSNVFSMGNAEMMGDFPLFEAAEALTNIMRAPENTGILDLATQCVYMFLEAHPSSTRNLINAGAFPVMKDVLMNGMSKDSVCNIVHCCDIIGEYRPDELVEPIGIEPLLVNFGMMRNAEKSCALRAAIKIADSNVTPKFMGSIKYIVNIIEAEPSLVKQASILLKLIIQKNNLRIVEAEECRRILTIANTCTEGEALANLVSVVSAFSRNETLAQYIFDFNFNYERIFDNSFGAKDNEIRRFMLNVIANLLPNIELPGDFWMKNKFELKDARAFALRIKPLIIKLLVTKSAHNDLQLSALTSTVQFEPIEWTPNLVSAIGALAGSNDMAPFVLCLLLACQDPEIIRRIDAIATFERTQPTKDSVKEWFAAGKERLKKLAPKESLKDRFEAVAFKTPEDIAEFVNKNQLSSYEFQSSSLMDKAIQVLESSDKVVENPELFAQFRDIVLDVVAFAPMPRVNDCLSNYDATELVTKNIGVYVVGPGGYSQERSFNLKLDLGAVGFDYLCQTDKINIDHLKKALAESKYKDCIIFPQSQVGVYSSQVTNVLSDIETDRFQKMTYKVNGVESFNEHDQLFSVLSQTNANPSDIISKKQVIEISFGKRSRSSPRIPKEFPETTAKALKLAELLYKRTKLNMVKPSFDQQARSTLSSPLLTMGFHTFQSRAIFHYPFLFPLETRLAFLRTAFVDLDNNQLYVRRVFNKEKWNDRTEMRAKIDIRRSNVLEDGLLIVKDAGPGCLRWDAHWDGELGIGNGPSKEFIQLLSKELCLNSLKMWRNESKDKYAMTKIGLFPAPFQSNNFWELGCLCGKALLMDVPVNIPLSEQFFAAIIGLPVPIESVDPMLAQSLKCPEGLIGLPFDYPGTEIHLNKEKYDEVTEKNLTEYVNAVIDATVGSGISKAINAFRSGFSEVIQWEALKIFTPSELVSIICGESCSFTVEEFEENIVLEHGYARNSPQIKMLLTIVSEFNEKDKEDFIKFITGCSALPIGGFRNLEPKITIARRESETGNNDDSLPTVATCNHYLKLPPYSSVDIMRKKLRAAITMCPTSFYFT